MNKKVTIQDIADALGISRNTVSKAINNMDGIATSTRENRPHLSGIGATGAMIWWRICAKAPGNLQR